MLSSRWIILFIFVVAGVLSRWIPHPPNFSPVMAIAIFSGVHFGQKKWALLFPISILLISDIVLGMHPTIWAVYLAFALATVMASRSSQKTDEGVGVGRIAILGIESSVLFFVVTNFAVWAQTGMYPMTFDGLIACYVAAVPFFQNSLLGNAVYISVMFGGFALFEKTLLRPVAVEAS